MVLHHTEYISKETYSKAKYTYNIQRLIYSVKSYIEQRHGIIQTRCDNSKTRSSTKHPLTPFEEWEIEEESE